MVPYYRRRNELSNDKRVLLWGVRVIIQPKFRNQLVEELHHEHTGVVHVKELAQSYLWYPGLDNDIEEATAKCEPCAVLQKDLQSVPFVPWPIAHTPWQRIHIDFGSLQGHDFLIITDSYS